MEAEIPGCEIFNLIIEVKGLTEGLGSFEHEFERMKTVQNKQLSDSLISEYSSKEKEDKKKFTLNNALFCLRKQS